MTSAPRGAFTSPGRSPGRRRRCTLGRGAPPWRPRDRTTAILLEASTRSLSCSIPGRGERASLTSLRVENWNIVSKSASISLIFKRGRRGRDGRETTQITAGMKSIKLGWTLIITQHVCANMFYYIAYIFACPELKWVGKDFCEFVCK